MFEPFRLMRFGLAPARFVDGQDRRIENAVARTALGGPGDPYREAHAIAHRDVETGGNRFCERPLGLVVTETPHGRSPDRAASQDPQQQHPSGQLGHFRPPL